MKPTFTFIVILIMRSAVAYRLSCEFRQNSQECKVNALNVPKEDLEITGITGRHGFRKTNEDVKEIWITREVASEYVPEKACFFFENMQRMDIYGRQIKHITRQVFTNCQKVTKVCILFTALTTLPEDLFEDLPEIKELLLYDSNLVILPENLVAKNHKLTSFSARTNQLIVVDTKFGPAMTVIDLTSNVCIDKKYNAENTSIAEINDDIASKCESSFKKTFKAKITALETKVTEKDGEIANLTDVNANLRYLNSALNQNVDSLNANYLLLKEENAERMKELEAIKTNGTELLAATFDENFELRTNLSICKTKVADKTQSAATLKAKNENLEGTAKDLRSQISAMQKRQLETEKNLLENNSRLDLLQFEYLNLNSSLEECWQNVSSFNEEIQEQDQHIADLEDDLQIADDNCTLKLNELRENFREAQTLIGSSCGHHVHIVYFVALAVAFLVIIIGTVCYMRRRASRTLIKSMISHEVNFKQLMSNE